MASPGSSVATPGALWQGAWAALLPSLWGWTAHGARAPRGSSRWWLGGLRGAGHGCSAGGQPMSLQSPHRPLTAPARVQEPSEALGPHDAVPLRALAAGSPPGGPHRCPGKRARVAQAESGSGLLVPSSGSTCRAAWRSSSASRPAPRVSAGHGGGSACALRPDPAGRSALPGNAIAAARPAAGGARAHPR